MKTVVLLSDIHANHVALDAVLQDIDPLVPAHVIGLGDVAVTGPGPKQVISRLRHLDFKYIRGNCDDAILRYAAGELSAPRDEHDAIDHWCATQLDDEDLRFIASFKPVETLVVEEVTLCCYHGSPESNLDEILPTTPESDLEKWFGDRRATVFAGAHSHVQMVRRFQNGYVINPGSVGLPFTLAAGGEEYKPLWAEYAVIRIHGAKLATELRRIPVMADAICSAASNSEMPHQDWWSSNWR